MINKSISLPTAGLTLLNLREILEKSSQESLSVDSRNFFNYRSNQW